MPPHTPTHAPSHIRAFCYQAICWYSYLCTFGNYVNQICKPDKSYDRKSDLCHISKIGDELN